jgi:hypothetical protein
MPVGSGVRLYPSETVGTAIEVKSNLLNQWNEVIRTAIALAPLRQKLNGIAIEDGSLAILNETKEPVPFYAVGYDSWSTASKVADKIQNAPVDGVLILKHQIFAWSDRLAYLRRLARCKDELDKKNRGEPSEATRVTCARIVELSEANHSLTDIAQTLNTEHLWVMPVHFGDQEYIPSVDSGSWTKRRY